MRTGDREEGRARPSFEVVFICTGNRARSPFAAALLRRHLVGLPTRVDSLGTLELAGAPALTGAVKAARTFGIDLTEHRSSPLAPAALGGVDLAIGFEPSHVASAVVTGGASSARAFLLTELADALGDAEPMRAPIPPSELVALANAHRLVADRLPRSIADPVGGPDRRFLATFDEIDRLVAVIASRLYGAIGEPTG